MLAGIAPSIVVVGLVDLNTKKFGLKKGLSSMVMATTPVDLIFAIIMASVLVNLLIPTSGRNTTVFRFIPASLISYLTPVLSLLLGLASGALCGKFVGYLTKTLAPIVQTVILIISVLGG